MNAKRNSTDKHQPQDIYATERVAPDRPITEADRRRIRGFWMRERSRSQRFTSVFVTGAVLGFAAIGAFTVFNYVKASLPLLLVEKEEPPRSIDAVIPLDLSADPRSMMVVDELSAIEPIEGMPEEGAPLSADWLKQAAYFVVRAEKYEQAKLHEEALAAYAEALSIVPDLRGVTLRLAQLQLRAKKYEAAITTFDRAMREEPMTKGLANNMGVAYMGLDQLPQAETHFKKALEEDDHYAPAHLNLARLYIAKDRIDDSITHYEKYLELNPADIDAAQAYALLLMRMERWDRAVGMLKQITLVQPDVAPLHFRLSQAMCNLEDFDGALIALKRGTALVDPKQALAWMARREYDPLRSRAEFIQLTAELGSVSD